MERSFLMPQRFLGKSKKYFHKTVQDKDKQNIVIGDIEIIVDKLYNQELAKSRYIDKFRQKVNAAKKQIERLSNSKHTTSFGGIKTLQCYSKLHSQNGHKTCFPQSQNSQFLKLSMTESKMNKQFKDEIRAYISKMNSLQKIQGSLYAQFIKLSNQSADYIDYYLTKSDSQLTSLNRVPTLQRNKCQKVLLCILKHNFKCLSQDHNPPQVLIRMRTSLRINSANDFQLIDWKKFTTIRKLISGQFTKREANQYLVRHFFQNDANVVTREEFWSITYSIVRKLKTILDDLNLGVLRERMTGIGNSLLKVEDSAPIGKEEFAKLLSEDVEFIWEELVRLIFIV